MSNIDQNKIISLLNEVIPQMQKSDDPEQTLIKFSSDKNLPPAVVERMCHAFNQLKTNCFLDAAESMEKRGSQFSLIEAPDLVKKYTDFTGSDEAKQMHNTLKDTSLIWDIPESDDSVSFKLASTTIKEGSIEDLYELKVGDKDFNDFVNNTIDSVIKKVAEENHAEDPKESLIYIQDAADKTIQNFDEFILDRQLEQDKLISKLAKDLSVDDSKLNKFASYEVTAARLEPICLDVIDSIVTRIAHKNSFVGENIKRASEKDYKSKELIRDVDDISKAIIEYANLDLQIKVARDEKDDELRRIWEELQNETPKKIVEMPSSLFSKSNKPEDKSDKTDKPEEDEAPKKTVEMPKGLFGGIADMADDFEKEQKERSKTRSESSKNRSESSKSNTDPAADIASIDPDLANILGLSLSGAKGAVKGLGDIGAGISSGLEDMDKINNFLMNLNAKTEKSAPKGKAPAALAIYNSTSDALLKRMLMTDPILMNLKGEELNNVLEAYKTYKIQYPEIAFQPALLRSALRGAAQVEGGEDIGALKELVSARKALADARAKEAELREKGQYLSF